MFQCAHFQGSSVNGAPNSWVRSDGRCSEGPEEQGHRMGLGVPSFHHRLSADCRFTREGLGVLPLVHVPPPGRICSSPPLPKNGARKPACAGVASVHLSVILGHQSLPSAQSPSMLQGQGQTWGLWASSPESRPPSMGPQEKSTQGRGP